MSESNEGNVSRYARSNFHNKAMRSCWLLNYRLWLVMKELRNGPFDAGMIIVMAE